MVTLSRINHIAPNAPAYTTKYCVLLYCLRSVARALNFYLSILNSVTRFADFQSSFQMFDKKSLEKPKNPFYFLLNHTVISYFDDYPEHESCRPLMSPGDSSGRLALQNVNKFSGFILDIIKVLCPDRADFEHVAKNFPSFLQFCAKSFLFSNAVVHDSRIRNTKT